MRLTYVYYFLSEKTRFFFRALVGIFNIFCVAIQIFVIVIVLEDICLELARMPNDWTLLPVDVTAEESLESQN